MMADPASGRCWLFYGPSLTSLLVLMRPVDKPHFNILDPQGPVPALTRGPATGSEVRTFWSAVAETVRRGATLKPGSCLLEMP